MFLLWSLTFAACNGRPEATSSPVVLVVVDTLRADTLAAYGGPVGAGGAVDSLATRGVLFEHAQASSPWTGPSVASVLTGRYPDEIGIHDIRDPLPRSVTNLAQRFQAAGYATGAVVSNQLAGPAYGHDKGYDHFTFGRYKDSRAGRGFGRPRFTADKVTDEALSVLAAFRGAAQEPFFLYVHYTDPHEPYLPPEPFRSQLLGGREPLPDDDLLQQRFAVKRPRPEVLTAVRAAYAGEVAFVDHEIGRLLAALPASAVVLLTADHGEEFLEHGRFFHGHTLYDELVRIPLVVAGPGVPPGRRVRDVVSHVDIAPTLLDLSRVPVRPESFSGRSLVPLFEGGSLSESAVHSVLEQGGTRWLAVRVGPYKLIESPEGPSGRRLYDLSVDARERIDLAAMQPRLVDSLASRIAQRRAAIVPLPDGDRDDRSAGERQRELRAIGYLP